MDAAALLSPSTLVPAILALSFAIGLNVYLTVLALGVMARMHWVALPPQLGILGSTPVMVASAVLFAAGFFADKIPGVDVLWNVAHTFVRVPAAALMAYAAGAQLTPEMHLLVTCAAVAAAMLAHGSKTAAHVAVTPSPEPFSNTAVSGVSDGLAIGITWLALHHPWAAASGAGVLAVAGVAGIWMAWRLLGRAVRKLRTRDVPHAQTMLARSR